MIVALALSWTTTTLACLLAWAEHRGHQAAAAQAALDAQTAARERARADRWRQHWRDLARADDGDLSDGAMTAILAAVHEPEPDPDPTQPLRPGMCVWPPYADRRPR